MKYELILGDAIEAMSKMATGSIDALISDPPYHTTNLAFDKAQPIDYPLFWPQAWRLLKPSGVVVLFAADLFTVDLILTQRANYRYRLVWCKSMGTGFLDAERRPLRAHEDVLIFCQQPSQWTYNPQKTPGKPYSNQNIKHRPQHYGAFTQAPRVNESGARHPFSFLHFGSEPTTGRQHPTQKPLDLMRWLVRTYTNPGDTVLDCFAGSGSTLAACLMEGRNGVGCELDAGYYAKATARLQALAAAPMLAFAAP